MARRKMLTGSIRLTGQLEIPTIPIRLMGRFSCKNDNGKIITGEMYWDGHAVAIPPTGGSFQWHRQWPILIITTVLYHPDIVELGFEEHSLTKTEAGALGAMMELGWSVYYDLEPASVT